MSFLKNISTPLTTDKELVLTYQQTGNLEVLGNLYQRYMDLVYGVCLKYLEDSENAKDAVMQVFEELVVKLQKHEVDNFKSWLYTLAKNYCLMQLRSHKNRKVISMNEQLMQNGEEMHLNGELQKEQQFTQLEACLQTLQEEQRKVVELFYLQQKCYNEITAATGMDWNKVRSLIQNGRRNLKICMEKKEKIASGIME
ncbi:MAG: sigma-70 family RNA polymerase sigma factor [Sphingobacteriales bacterium]|nr:MAG: sigma-70 family RNA polymerase sigma factor [Sphingobacteriales bacterium]